MAHDQHLLWTTKGSKASKKDPNLDPYSLYDFFSNANAARLRQGRPIQRIRSAAPRIGPRQVDGKSSVTGSPLESHVSLRNPSPTPATSRPLSSRSGRSSLSSFQKCKPAPSTSPTSMYLGLHKARCKSAPPRPVDYYLPQKPKSGKSRVGSAALSARNAPKRAWQNRISSAKSQHSLLSREEVQKRHKERCKSAPLPYDFSAIEVVTSVPEHGSDIQRLKAFTRPLTCMPDVIQNVLSHNGLRHCCSAYQPRPKSSSCSVCLAIIELHPCSLRASSNPLVACGQISRENLTQNKSRVRPKWGACSQASILVSSHSFRHPYLAFYTVMYM